MAASANPLLSEAESRDPMIFCTAYQKPRFYIFTNDNTASKSDRDIFNEKPTREAGAPEKGAGESAVKETGKAAIIHTTMGDIHVRLFPEAAPKTVENFVTHARNGYYNGTIFHRVIRKFMIQGGDPLGDGTGGESIWGGEFEDEFSTLKHDKPYTLSMANAGPSMLLLFLNFCCMSFANVYARNRHERITILHHDGENAVVRRETYNFRKDDSGVRCGQQDREC